MPGELTDLFPRQSMEWNVPPPADAVLVTTTRGDVVFVAKDVPAFRPDGEATDLLARWLAGRLTAITLRSDLPFNSRSSQYGERVELREVVRRQFEAEEGLVNVGLGRIR